MKFLKSFAVVVSLLLGSITAWAQPGPPPNPWIQSGNTISYNRGGATMGTPTGGSQGIGSINVTNGYYVNGVKLTAVTSATAPIVFSAGVISLNIDSRFAVVSNNLALASGAAGCLIANTTAGSAEPSCSTWTAFADRAIGSSNGMLPYRTGGAWGNISTGVSGGTIPLNNTANIFSVQQTINLNTASLPASLAGASLNVGAADGVVARIQANAFGAIASFSGAIYGGTNASPTAVTSGTQLTGLNAYAYNGASLVGPIVSFRAYAAENIASGHQGTQACIATTPIASTTLADGLCQANDGGITVPSTVTGGSKGSGTINASALYINGTAVSLSAANLTVGVSTITSGANTRILYDLSGVLGEYTITGTGTVVAMQTSPSFITPAIGVATGTSLALGVGLSVGSSISGSGNIDIAATASFFWSGRSQLLSPSDGIIKLANNANADFTRLQFGGTTASFPSIKRNSTAINIRLADDSADAPFTAGATTISAALTYGGVTLSNSATGTGSMVLSISASLVTPALGVATATSVAIGGATIGSNGLAVTGTALFNSTINVVTGIQINGAATTAHYLRGNGTNYVDSAILAGDLPLGSSAAFGAVKCDNTTIVCTAGVISAVGAVASSISASGSTSISGGTTNQLLYDNAGNVGEITKCNSGIYATNASGVPSCSITPTIGVAGTSAGTIGLSGVTSGVVTIQTANAAGTWSLTLPTTGGTNLFFLQTNGSGVSTWAAAGTVTSITCNGGLTGGAITASGTCAADIATNSNTWSATANKMIDAAVLNGAGALTTLTDAATIAVDMSTFVNGIVTLAGNRTLGAPSATQVGRTGCIYVVQDGTGSRTLAYNSVWKFAGGVAPTLTTTASASDMLCYTVRTSTFITATLTKDVKLLDEAMPWEVLLPWYKEPANDNMRDIDREKAA